MDGSRGSSDGVIIPLLDLLDALVNDRGKVAAAEALGVNYRTLAACYDSRHVSRRMRRALEEHRNVAIVDGDDPAGDDAGDVSKKLAALEERVTALEEENHALKETVEAQQSNWRSWNNKGAHRRTRNGNRAGLIRWAMTMTDRNGGGLHDGITGCPMPGWSRWRNSLTRSTPLALLPRWWPSGEGFG